MRYLQNTLLIIGTTALSTVAGVFAVGALVGLFQRPGGEPWTRGFGQYIGGLVCGAPLGALAGFIGSISFVGAQSESRSWNPLVWIGIVLGIAAGIALCFHWGMTSGNQWELVVALVAIATGAAGGIVAHAILALYRAVSKTG